jgi:hypothetical protein
MKVKDLIALLEVLDEDLVNEIMYHVRKGK